MDAQQQLAAATRISDIVRVWAQQNEAAPAIRDPQWQLSYGQLWRAISQAQVQLAAAGVVAGDRVLLVAENCVQQVALIFACVELGAWPASVNSRVSAREIDTIAAHCEPRLLLFSAAVSPEASEHARRLGAVPWQGDDFFSDWSALSARTDVLPEAVALAADVAALVYTSGTTGAPKGVMVSHQGLLHFARISCQSRALGPADHVYGALPLAHIFGFATVLLSTMYAGACLTLERRFTPEHLLAALAHGGITTFQGVPILFTRVLEHLQQSGSALSAPALRYLYSGGASLDMAVKRQVEATFGLPLHQGYGMTEYAGSMFITRTDAPRDDDSSGYRNEGVELMLVDEVGHEVAPGDVGDIRVRGPGVMRGYYRNLAATQDVLSADGWFSTGDLGRVDASGALFIVGRSKDLIIRSGFNVYPVEVEAVLNAWPGVQLSAVVGVPEEGGNEAVIAFVELAPGQRLDRAGLNHYLKQQLAPYKRPERVLVLSKIPVTINGKLQKLRLREWLQQGGDAADIQLIEAN